MKELLEQFIEKAKTDKLTLLRLKGVAVKCQQFELAMQLRELEKELFPESEEVVKSKRDAEELSRLFRMVELSIPDHICFMISETLSLHKKRKGNFTLADAERLMTRQRELYPDSTTLTTQLK